jgi:3-hydroxyisobutyrate dehydrogenase-like beta-hydroxyacid dehydrogenase
MDWPRQHGQGESPIPPYLYYLVPPICSPSPDANPSPNPQGMCKNLVEKGNLDKPLIIHNRTTSRAHDLSSKIGNSTVADSISSTVSQSDIIFLCLGDDAAVRDTISQALKADDVKGKLFVDCSTIHPDTTEEVAKAVEKAGASFVACPVFGAPAMADAGQLVCVLAGTKELVEKVKPYCEGVMGKAVIDYSGSSPGKATLLKVIGNTFILSMVETISEGHVVAEKTGLGVEALHQFIEAMFPGPYVAYSNRMKSGDYYQREEPLFAVNLARKDAGHAMALAQRNGVQMKNVQLADGYLKGVQEHMKERGDIAGIYGAKRVEAGLKFENKD